MPVQNIFSIVGERTVITRTNETVAPVYPTGLPDEASNYRIMGVVTLVFAALFLAFLLLATPVILYRCRPSQPSFPLYGTRKRQFKAADPAGEGSAVLQRLHALISPSGMEGQKEQHMESLLV